MNKKSTSKKAGSLKKSKNVKTIFTQLKSEHDDLKKILEKTEKSQPSQRTDYLEKICKELIPHARGEEKTLYAVFRLRAQNEGEDSLDLANEGYEEHLVADSLIEILKDIDVESERWIPMFKVLKENLEHHIREEENEIFKQCKKLFSKEEQVLLLDAYFAAKESFSEDLPAQKEIAEREPSSQAEMVMVV